MASFKKQSVIQSDIEHVRAVAQEFDGKKKIFRSCSLLGFTCSSYGARDYDARLGWDPPIVGLISCEGGSSILEIFERKKNFGTSVL